ncbi:RSP_7527 family protein [Paracoccaceae bacterium GXU_MW_L88]
MTRTYLTNREREDILNRAHAMRSAFIAEHMSNFRARIARLFHVGAHA